MADVSLEAVTKRFGDGTRAVSDLSLHVKDGEFTVLVGPSGCGKTTALRMVAGLEHATSGAIRIGSEVVNEWAPRHRDVAMVFQNYALYPNMTVAENMAFGLTMRKVSRDERRRKVSEIAGVLGLEEMLERKPGALSGGQRQRVAMGRAIVRNPRVFLMDEPLSNLDAKLRVQMRAEIARIQQEVGTTTIYVTHDQVEAMTMGSRVAVMRKGALQQYGTPRAIYDAPANLFVASFIGSPAMNLFRARLDGSGPTMRVEFGREVIALTEMSPATRKRLAPHHGTIIGVGVRPEALLSRPLGQADTSVRVRAIQAEQLGSEIILHGKLDAPPVATSEVREVAADIDASLAAGVERTAKETETTVLAKFGPREELRINDVIDVFVDRSALHFFDLETQEAIATTIPGVDDAREA